VLSQSPERPPGDPGTAGSVSDLGHAVEADRYGGKAVHLGTAIRHGLPVPPGYALSTGFVDAVAGGDPSALAAVARISAELGLVAVRSSAVDEDSEGASFAGAHLSVLGVTGTPATVAAVRAVRDSAHDAGAQKYRDALGLDTEAKMAVVVQQLLDADVAGVLFSRNPVTGAHERVIEASWGLGESVVSGAVTPDSYRVAPGGRVLERRLGDKDIAIRPVAGPDGVVVTEEVPVDPALEGMYCLSDAQLTALDTLVSKCDAAYGSTDHDIEFAFRGTEVFLLQRRPITRA
jgi:pyruvate, water dikinase